VALLRALPAHMSFVLIEHDLDIALRVVERVTCHAQRPRTAHRHAGRDRERRPGAGDLHGEQALMAWFRSARAETPAPPVRGPVLAIDGLDVYYGRAHALQGVSLALERGVLGIVGRNGMGKTTLCNAITGLVPATGSIRLAGEESSAARRTRSRAAALPMCPQGRRVWPSLSVDETLRLVAPARRDVDGIYGLFPRLAERRGHGGAQLSGGEQQMLAIGRALLLNPKLLVMDEPTEGSPDDRRTGGADPCAELARRRRHRRPPDRTESRRGNGGGRSHRRDGQRPHRAGMPASQLAADRELQERMLGVRAGAYHDEIVESPEALAGMETAADAGSVQQVFTVRRAYGDGAPALDDPTPPRGTRLQPAGITASGAAPVPDIRARRRRRHRRRCPRRRRHRHRPRCQRRGRYPGSAATSASARQAGAGLRLPRRRRQRPRGVRRRHVRHQGRASFSTCASAWKSSGCAW
jgi:ABC-type branched-subunit amino acid transport system ATPase component